MGKLERLGSFGLMTCKPRFSRRGTRGAIESLKIFLAIFVGTTLYGILHDQVKARMCVEYFTLAHPALVDSSAPAIVGLAWGIVATWRFGAVLGLAAAGLARFGPWPKWTRAKLVGPLGWLVAEVARTSKRLTDLATHDRLSATPHRR